MLYHRDVNSVPGGPLGAVASLLAPHRTIDLAIGVGVRADVVSTWKQSRGLPAPRLVRPLGKTLARLRRGLPAEDDADDATIDEATRELATALAADKAARSARRREGARLTP